MNPFRFDRTVAVTEEREEQAENDHGRGLRLVPDLFLDLLDSSDRTRAIVVSWTRSAKNKKKHLSSEIQLLCEKSSEREIIGFDN